MRTLPIAALLLLARIVSAEDLPTYLTTPDDAYQWKDRKSEKIEGATVTAIRLTSQKWHGLTWRHWLHVIVPEKVKVAREALLLINGGSNRKKIPALMSPEVALLAPMAVQTGTVIAVLSQVPNEPLFDDLSEDALVAHTFAEFLDTKDESWPCLIPMTKAAMRAMDAVQEFVGKDNGPKIEKFFVTGASKRGWTTWLTAAADPRVVAIAPMVIDTLNMGAQMKLQVESFGGFSEQIGDYTALDLQKRMMEPAGKRLLELVDPYSYRDRLKMPKLLVFGTNDRYWPVDAVKLYFNDLPGEKYIHYVPNAGHGLGPGAVEVISAFYRMSLDGKEPPKFSWKLDRQDDEAVLTVTADDAPVKVELWQTSSPSRDFRDDKWEGAELSKADASWVARVKVPQDSFVAFHARLTYHAAFGPDYALCTNNEVVGAKK